MLIKQLRINNVRNLQQVDLQLDAKINIFVGLNGSGKTSLLESICFLALGRSFRLNNIDGLINFTKPFATVSAVYVNQGSQQIKISTIKHKHQEKINKIGGAAASLSQIAFLAPTQIIHEGSSKLIFAEPEGRRKFLDWIVFYAHNEYQHLWREFNRVLQQRNSLLKDHNSRNKLSILKELDKIFINLSEQIKLLRTKSWQCFYNVWLKCFEDLGLHADLQPEIKLFHGWEGDLQEKLSNNLEMHMRLGFTNCGPQRADLYFSINDKPAKEVLSRGQGKAVSLSLILARSLFLQQIKERTGIISVLLIDDLGAELDNINGQKIMDFLLNASHGLQIFITGIKENRLLRLLPKQQGSWFYIDQGEVVPRGTY